MIDRLKQALNAARNFLSNVSGQPWFPNRKVIAGAISAAVTQFVQVKLSIDLPSGLAATIDGAVGAFVAYMIPERPTAILHGLKRGLTAGLITVNPKSPENGPSAVPVPPVTPPGS